MLKRLEVAVPEVRLQFYSINAVKYEHQFMPEDWFDEPQVTVSRTEQIQLFFHFVRFFSIVERKIDFVRSQNYR